MYQHTLLSHAALVANFPTFQSTLQGRNGGFPSNWFQDQQHNSLQSITGVPWLQSSLWLVAYYDSTVLNWVRIPIHQWRFKGLYHVKQSNTPAGLHLCRKPFIPFSLCWSWEQMLLLSLQLFWDGWGKVWFKWDSNMDTYPKSHKKPARRTNNAYHYSSDKSKHACVPN